MNHLLFDGIQAINQVGFLLCGLVLLGLGLAIIGHELYWRVHAQRVDGILAGVRTKNGFYYNVYHYVLPGTGDAIEATSTTGSNSLRGRTTGTPVRLMAMPSNPEHAEPAKSWIAFIASNFLVMLGALFVWLPLRYFPVTRITWWMLAGFAVFATFRIKKLFRPPSSLSAQASGLGAAVSQWKADRITKRRAELQTLPVVPAEQIQPAPWAPRFAQHSSTNPKAAAAVMIVGGVVLLAIGSWMARNTIRLAHSGIRAPGAT